MSYSKTFPIKETIKEIMHLQGKATPIISKRLTVLFAFKRHELEGISKRLLAAETGFDANSIQSWRSLYIKCSYFLNLYSLFSAIFNHFRLF